MLILYIFLKKDISLISYNCILGLVNIREFQVFLGLITKEVTDCSNRLSTLDQDLLRHLTDLQTTIGSQLAVPSTNVYPQFIRLALTWQGFQVKKITPPPTTTYIILFICSLHKTYLLFGGHSQNMWTFIWKFLTPPPPFYSIRGFRLM